MIARRGKPRKLGVAFNEYRVRDADGNVSAPETQRMRTAAKQVRRWRQGGK